MSKELWKGNEAIAEAAIRAGCDCYFGYPITPQSEVPEYMSSHMPKAGRVFVQAESELAAINMVYGLSLIHISVSRCRRRGLSPDGPCCLPGRGGRLFPGSLRPPAAPGQNCLCQEL